MNPGRPEWVKCIAHTHAEKKGTAWCGRSISANQFRFVGIDHAVYSTMNGDRLVPCPECAAKVISVLQHP